MWSAFSNLFSSRSNNSSSYKFGFLKAIMDNLYNVDEKLTLTFDQLFDFMVPGTINLTENAAALGIPVPKKLKRVLEQLKEEDEKDDD